MRFRVEIELDRLPEAKAREVGRILQYWGGWSSDELLVPGTTHDLTDSADNPVGQLRVLGDDEATSTGSG